MIYNSPPLIFDSKIELMGSKGKEEYNVKSIYVYDCKCINESCVHDISIECSNFWGVYFFIIHNVTYNDLKEKNYLPYLSIYNKMLIQQSKIQSCQFITP